MELKTIQNRFAEALIAADEKAIETKPAKDNEYGKNAKYIKDTKDIKNPKTAEYNVKRIATYQNNYYGSLTKTLANRYPVTERLLGSAYFKKLARNYINTYPSATYDLNLYGRDFSEFILELQQNSQHELNPLGYLADIVDFESKIYQVLFGPNSKAFDFNAFANVSPNSYESLIFELTENYQMISSEFPLDTIWEMHQSLEIKTDIDLSQRSLENYSILVWRSDSDSDLELRMLRLNPFQKKLIGYLEQGLSMKFWYEDLDLSADADKDKEGLSLALVEFIRLGCIRGFLNR